MTAQCLKWIPVCVLAAAPTAAAQERLSLADVTARALEKNHTMRIEREGIATADARMTSAKGQYDIQFNVGIEGRHHKDPITTIFSGAPEGDVAPTSNDFSWTASMTRLFSTGAVATLSTSAFRENTNSVYSLFRPAYITSLGVDLRQPLLRNRANDPARTALRVTALDRDRSGAALRRQALQTVSEVEQAYWTLVAARRDLETRRSTLALAEAQRRDTEVRIEARTMAAADLAQPTAEVERRRGDLFAAQESIARAERALKQLMLDDAADPLWTVELVPVDLPAVQPVSIDIAAALRDATRLRPEMADIAAQVSQDEANVALARDELKPRLDLIASYTTYGLGGGQNEDAVAFEGVSPIVPASLSGSLGTSWDAMARQKFPDATLGVAFEIPLGRREARGKIGAAEAARRQSLLARARTEQQIAVEVRNAATAIETAIGRVQAARAGLVAAETQLRAEQDRFSVGATTNFFVLTRQNDLALAQVAETAALADYQKATTEFARATGTLLNERGIDIR